MGQSEKWPAEQMISATGSGLPCHHISFIPFKLACPFLPTMMWSCTEMPSGLAMLTIAFVIWMSACDGVGSPEGPAYDVAVAPTSGRHWHGADLIIAMCFARVERGAPRMFSC